jgi:hypothetical protein
MSEVFENHADMAVLKKCKRRFQNNMNEDELRNNEKFADLFSHFLCQARVTKQRERSLAEETEEIDSQQGI